MSRAGRATQRRGGEAGTARGATAGSVLLARHGETDDNLEPLRVQGFRDTPLNDTGRRQAAELAERMVGAGIASLWSSDLSRARETAEIVAARIGLQPRLDPRLREANRGQWEGRLFINIEREEPERFAAWRRAGEAFRFPGGESLRDQLERVSAAIDDVRRSEQLPALIVCHGGSIRVMLCAHDPRGLDAFHAFEVPNAAVVAL
jgi:broad specificity phosphatase PhoE